MTFQVISTNSEYFFWFFTETLTLLFPVPRCAGDNTDLHSNSNISKTIRVNIAFTTTFFKEYSINFLMVCRFIDFAHVVLTLLMFKVCGIIGISKTEVFNFSGTERVKYFSVYRFNMLLCYLYFCL